MSEQRTAKVSSLVRYLKRLTEGDRLLQGIRVEGEISNLRMPYSGHWYFSLKDEQASISCVMFSSSNRRVAKRPQNGDKVVITGNVSVYEASGTLQIIATMMEEAGIGDLYKQLELLKKKLYAEGLFDPAHKKQLPRYPMNIALVTGNNTAAREDVLITLKKRWPAASVHEYPCPVQGMQAAPEIIEALAYADNGGHDVILLVRGGGSIEDLWCFNDEALARFIYSMHTPVVTGIGHEIDFTLADYTADVRANTPTGAVEAAVPDRMEVLASLQTYRSILVKAADTRIAREKTQLQHMRSSYVFAQPERLVYSRIQQLENMHDRLMMVTNVLDRSQLQLHRTAQRFRDAMHGKTEELRAKLQEDRTSLLFTVQTAVDRKKRETDVLQESLVRITEQLLKDRNTLLQKQAGLLDAFSPLKVLSRGYSVVYKEDRAVASAESLSAGDDISVRFSDGMIRGKVISREELHEQSEKDI